MATYGVARDNQPLSTTNDFMTLVPAANHPIQVVEISVCGMGTASAANSIGVYRSTGGVTGGGALTPTPMGKSGAIPAPNTVVDTTWSTQPTLTGSGFGLVLDLGVNANGGIYRWVARPGEEILVNNTDTLSIRGITGSSSLSIHIVFVEDPL